MFRVIGVDDEKIALDRFERILKEDARVSVVGTFTHVVDAIEFVRRNPVDIAFLDIEMPGLSGLELAERLTEIDPCLEIVFITAYEKYALQAFQAHAIGYLLKPLDIDEIGSQIDSLDRKLGPNRRATGPGYLTVQCLGQYLCYADDNAAAPIHWRTAKAEELFALLIHYQGIAVSREVFIDVLWPEVQPEKAANNFRVTCTYLRNTLAEKGFTNILLRDRGSYLLDTSRLCCDLLLFLSAAGSASADLPALEKASALYAGGYFENKPYEWTANMQAWLENEFKKIQRRLADEYQILGQNERACAALERSLLRDPYDEEAVEPLLLLKLQSGDSVAAAKIYRDYEQRLFKELALAPSDRLRGLMAAVTQ